MSEMVLLSRKFRTLKKKQLLVFTFIFCFIFVWRCWCLSQEVQTRYLQVIVNTPVTETAQLYYDQGDGFNEHDSVVALPKPKNSDGSSNQSYQFQLTPSVIFAMRFVLDGSGDGLQIQNMDVLNGLGIHLRNIDLASFIISQKGDKQQVSALFDPPLQLGGTQTLFTISFVAKALVEGSVLGFVMILLLLLYQGGRLLGTSLPIIIQFIGYFKKPVNQDTIIFVVLTAVYMLGYQTLNEQWFPLLFGKALFCFFVILIIRFFMQTGIQQRAMNSFCYWMLFYLLLIVTSATLHYFAVNMVGGENYISIFKPNFAGVLFQKHEGVKRLVDNNSAFMYFFPFVLFVTIALFRSSERSWQKLVWIPIIFVPCIVIAFYQVYIDRTFLNNRPLNDFMGGLCSSFIGFRFMLFLLFPLFVFVVMVSKRWWKKILFLVLSGCVLWLTYLGYSRATILGTMIFVAVLPVVWCWVRGGTKLTVYEYISIGLIIVLGVTVLIGFATPKYHNIMSKLFTSRVVLSANAIIKGDFADEVIGARTEMSRQSWRLIKMAPVSGWGPAAFMKNADRVRSANGDPPGVTQTMTSLYLLALGNFGIIGLGVMLLLHIIPLWMVFRVRKQIHSQEERWAVGILFTTVLITLLLFNTNPNIDYPEVNWVYCLCLGFLVSVALKYGYVSHLHLRRRWLFRMGGLLLFIAFIAGTYRTTFGTHGYETIQKELLAGITNSYQQDDSVTIWDSEQVAEGSKVSNTLIKTRGNPFRVKYVNNEFRMQAASKPFNLHMNSNLFCVRTSVVKQGDRGSFILGVRVLVNNELVEKHNFYIEGEKMLYYKLPESYGKNAEIKVEIDLRKSIPYHQDYRTKVTQEYMPDHIDYKDLTIKVDVISFT